MSCVHGWLLHSAASQSTRRFTFFLSLFFPHVTQKMTFHTSTRHETASHQMINKTVAKYLLTPCFKSSKANPCNLLKWRIYQPKTDWMTPWKHSKLLIKVRDEIKPGTSSHVLQKSAALKCHIRQQVISLSLMLKVCYTLKSHFVMGAPLAGWHDSMHCQLPTVHYCQFLNYFNESVKIIPTFFHFRGEFKIADALNTLFEWPHWVKLETKLYPFISFFNSS